MPHRRILVELPTDADLLAAIEPTMDEVRGAAQELARAYNEPHNREMIANTTDFAAGDVVAHFERMRAEGARSFLLLRDGALVGDADFRHIEPAHAEFALLIASRGVQGKGLGTRFALMLHGFGFRALGVARMYVTIVPQNAASLRLFAKLGYAEDASELARSFADDASDVSLSLGRDEFERAHGAALSGVRFRERA